MNSDAKLAHPKLLSNTQEYEMNSELVGIQRQKQEIKFVDSPYKTVTEAAEYLRLNPRTLNNMRSASKGPSFHKHGRRVLYHIDELVRWSSLTKKVMEEPSERPEKFFA